MGAMTMEPSRELDALVAEKVMGWRRVDDRLEWPGPHSWIWVYDVPKFSTEPAAAWQILELIHGDADGVPRFLFSRRRQFYAALSVQCVTEGGLIVAWPEALGVFRDQMPLFICRAALSAVGA